jgi:hypothetical protein
VAYLILSNPMVNVPWLLMNDGSRDYCYNELVVDRFTRIEKHPEPCSQRIRVRNRVFLEHNEGGKLEWLEHCAG